MFLQAQNEVKAKIYKKIKYYKIKFIKKWTYTDKNYKNYNLIY